MKKTIFYAFILLLSLVFSACSDFSAEVKESEAQLKRVLNVSNVTFDSTTYKFNSDITAPDGKLVTLTVNGVSCQGFACNQKISLTLDTPFLKNLKGGKEYEIYFSAEDYIGTKTSVSYWPKVSYKLLSLDEITIYNGGAKDFVEPDFILQNYDESQVTYKTWFKLYKNYGMDNQTEIEDVDVSNWKISDLKNYLADLENDGNSVEVHFSVTPDCEGGENLAAKGFVLYHCKKDVLVKSVGVSNSNGKLVAHLYADEEVSDESEAETAGGIVAFQWQCSNDGKEENFRDVPGAVGKLFSVTRENVSEYLGKTFRVKITQTFEGAEQASIYSATYPFYHTIVNSELYYDGLLLTGETFDVSKVKGVITDELGQTYTEKDFTLQTISELDETENYYLGTVSKNFYLQCMNNDFYDFSQSVFVTVRNSFTEEELPLLSTDTASMEAGNVKFTEINKDLEYSVDGRGTYTEIPEGEFEASSGDIIYIRKKAYGIPNADGYIKESEALPVTVKDENIGKSTSGGSIINNLETLKLTLKKSTDGNLIVIKPVYTYTDDEWEYEYTWLIDGVDALTYTGVSKNENNELVIDSSEFSAETYQLFCLVKIYLPLDDDLKLPVANLSQQISLVMNMN